VTTETTEITGLTSAQQFAAGMAAAHAGAIAHTESFRASVTNAGVTGTAVSAADRAAAAQADAAAAWQRAHAALLEQNRIAEAYAANPDAGSREFLTDAGGASTSLATPTTSPTSAAPLPEAPVTQPNVPGLPTNFELREAFGDWTFSATLERGDETIRDGDDPTLATGLVLNLEDQGGDVVVALTRDEALNTYSRLTGMLITGSRKHESLDFNPASGGELIIDRDGKTGEFRIEGVDYGDHDEDSDEVAGGVAIDLSVEDAQELHVRLTGLLLTTGWLAFR
jgi:hypothetical protein